jgi:hypothetical protein
LEKGWPQVRRFTARCDQLSAFVRCVSIGIVAVAYFGLQQFRSCCRPEALIEQ